MKKNYNTPEINISVFTVERVLTSSGYSEAQNYLESKEIAKDKIYEINFKDIEFTY